MKFKIIFSIVMVTAFISVYTIVNAVSGGIAENQAGLNRLNKSFLSLSEEFQDVKERINLMGRTEESYHNSLVDVSNRLASMEETTYAINSILQDLDSQLNPKLPSVNEGLGVLTGTHNLIENQETD
jgi:hypothetical protein|tara:strand:+ start:50 stop:430 length:381 start_codon:yes stop_codon:yes gene_type:complete